MMVRTRIIKFLMLHHLIQSQATECLYSEQISTVDQGDFQNNLSTRQPVICATSAPYDLRDLHFH